MKKLILFLLLACNCLAQPSTPPSPSPQQRAVSMPAFTPQYLPPYPALAGLRVYVTGGSVIVSGVDTVIPSQYIGVPANTTTYVYVDLNLGVISTNTTGFTGNIYPVASATTNNTIITNLQDV